MIKDFRSRPRRAAAYLNAALEIACEQNDPSLLLSALATVARARGMSKVARDATLQRESLHRMLSKKGNPQWRSLFRVLRALDLRPRIDAA
ncbi:MAG: putative addiction module antidote protein [Elusimicrobia bacterium CG1_02_63_36]|nr:MAG: putative addiction module antidote protein [Elusimicrobia bacterium CG1_02_63_36]